MISDFVKGSAQYSYSPMIQKGIQLHRWIDAFTDLHQATADAKNFFRPTYRLYSGPIVDVLYDHFLANDIAEFKPAALEKFTASVYRVLEQHAHVLPPAFVFVFGYMKQDNWLYNYRTTEGISKTLRGISRRSTYMKDSSEATSIFLENYEDLKDCYHRFFPDVKQMAKQKLDDLLK